MSFRSVEQDHNPSFTLVFFVQHFPVDAIWSDVFEHWLVFMLHNKHDKEMPTVEELSFAHVNFVVVFGQVNGLSKEKKKFFKLNFF